MEIKWALESIKLGESNGYQNSTALSVGLGISQQALSHIEEDWWLVRELLLFNTDDWAEDWVVDVWQVCLSWSLSDSSEFVVDGSVTQANPSLVCTKIWYWNTSQMGANGWADQNLGVTSVGKSGDRLFIQLGGQWKGVGIFNFSEGKSSNEDDLTVPSSLEAFTWWELRDIEFLVGVSNVSGSGDHLVIDNSDNGLDSNNVSWKDESLHHVHLSSLDFIVSVFFVPESILIKPVIGLGLGIKRISEVGWSWRSDPVSWSLGTEKVVNKLFVLSLIVLLNDTEVSWLGS